MVKLSHMIYFIILADGTEFPSDYYLFAAGDITKYYRKVKYLIFLKFLYN